MNIFKLRKKSIRYSSNEFNFPKKYKKLELGVGKSKVFK